MFDLMSENSPTENEEKNFFRSVQVLTTIVFNQASYQIPGFLSQKNCHLTFAGVYSWLKVQHILAHPFVNCV